MITDTELVETLLLGHQEIITALRSLRTQSPEEEDAIGRLENVFDVLTF